MAAESEVDTLSIRFTGDVSDYASAIQAALAVTNEAVKQIEASTARLAKFGTAHTADQVRATTESAKAEAERAKQLAEGARVTESVMTGKERYAATTERLNELLKSGAISQTTFDRAMTQSTAQYKQANDGLAQLSGTLKMYAGALIATATAYAVSSVSGRAINLAQEAESQVVAFGTMLKSQERGAELVAKIQKLAADTPLKEVDLTQASRTLLQFGISGEKIIPTLQKVGEVTGGDSDRLQRMSLAFGQMTANGRLMGEELNQMIEAGFNPLKEIARTSGKAVSELRDDMEKGRVTVKEVENAFKTASSEGGQFFNFMQKQSQTMKGLLSTARDDIDATLRFIGTEIIEKLNLKGFTRGISDAAKSVGNYLKGLSPEGRGLIFTITAVVGAIAGLAVVSTVAALAARGLGMAWAFTTATLTAAAARISITSMLVGGLKIALVGLAIVAVKSMFDLATGADKARREFEFLQKQMNQMKENADKVTDDMIKKINMEPDLDQRLKMVDRDITITTKMDMKEIEANVKALKATLTKLEAGEYGPDLKAKFQPGTTRNEAIEIQKRFLLPQEARLANLDVRRSRLEELRQEIVDAMNPAGQLAATIKKLKEDLEETSNFAGLDRWNKQLVELNIALNKANADDGIRKKAMGELVTRQETAKRAELTAAIWEHIMALRAEADLIDMTDEQKKYKELWHLSKDTGSNEDNLKRVQEATANLLRMRDQKRLADQGRKMMEEYRDPVEKYQETVAELKEMLDRGFITKTVFEKALDNAKNSMDQATGAANKLKEALEGIQGVKFWSADGAARLREGAEAIRMRMESVAPKSNYQFRLPAWIDDPDARNGSPFPPKMGVVEPGAAKIPMKVSQAGGVGKDVDDREMMVRLLDRIAKAAESLDKKPTTTLKPANL